MGALTRRILALEQREKSRTIREVGPTYDVADSLVPWFHGSLVQGDLDQEDEP
jgi:hypothetical protein